MTPFRLTMLNIAAILFLISIGLSNRTVAITTEEAINKVYICAQDSNIKISAEGLASLREFFEGDKQIQIEGTVSMGSGFLQLFPESERAEMYKLYVNCITKLNNSLEEGGQKPLKKHFVIFDLGDLIQLYADDDNVNNLRIKSQRIYIIDVKKCAEKKSYQIPFRFIQVHDGDILPELITLDERPGFRAVALIFEWDILKSIDKIVKETLLKPKVNEKKICYATVRGHFYVEVKYNNFDGNPVTQYKKYYFRLDKNTSKFLVEEYVDTVFEGDFEKLKKAPLITYDRQYEDTSNSVITIVDTAKIKDLVESKIF